MQTILTWMTFAPMMGVAAILAMVAAGGLLKLDKKLVDNASRVIGLTATAVPLALGAVLALKYDPNASGVQFEHHFVWIRSFNIEYFMGVDGVSISMVLLTVLITFIAAIASVPWWGPVDEHHFTQRMVPGYWVMLLILETGMLGTFVSLDFFLFYVFWEIMLLPMYFLIGIWGGPRKEYAAIKFFLYTLAGSVLMLLAVIGLYYNSHPTTLVDGTVAKHTFNVLKMIAENDYSTAPAILGFKFVTVVWIALFIGFAIKIPMFPFHTWLPDAHVEAPTPISVILAGVLLKMGGYGIFRMNFGILPEATVDMSNVMAAFGAINIVYAAFVCLAQRDLKKLIAYSSVSHMGFVLLGMAAFTHQGMNGAMFQMFAHGIVSPMLFLIVGVIYDRAHHRNIEGFGGIASEVPEYTGMMGLAFFASLGLPGLIGFVGEFTVFLGAFPAHTVLTIVSASAVVITAAYYLWTIQRMFLGKLNEKYRGLPDLFWRERFTLYPLAVISIVLGFYPLPVFKLIENGMAMLIAGLPK